MTKLTSIWKLSYEIELVDGTRVGGGGSSLEIGAAVEGNLAVLKNPVNDEPYIPGSSIKGKLRSTAEKIHCRDLAEDPCSCGLLTCRVCPLFGAHIKKGRKEAPASAPTRIIVRDAPFTNEYRKEYDRLKQEGKLVIEEKAEVSVSRLSGRGHNPRTGERVAPGAKFLGEIVIHVYEGDNVQQHVDTLRQAMAFVAEADALGAGGSRGSGRVRFLCKEVTEKPVSAMKIALPD